MKKLIIGLLLVTFAAQAALAQSCREKVENHYRDQLEWMHSYDYVSGSSAFTSLGMMGSFLVAASLSSPLTFMLTMPIGIGVIVFDTTYGYARKEDRYLTMVQIAQAHEAGTKFFKKIVRKAQRHSPNITAEEVALLIQDGFDNGELCSNKNFVRPNRVKRYVMKMVRMLYPDRNP